MKISWLAAFVFLTGSAWSQNHLFLNHVHESSNYVYSTDVSASQQRLNLVNFDADYVSGLFIRILQDERSRRQKSDLVQDSLLNRIAGSAIATYSRARFTYGKIWDMEERNIKYALQREESEHKIYAAHAFVMDVLDLQFARAFYFDPKVGTSSLDLYLGNKPSARSAADPDYTEPVPVESITGELFKDRLLKLVSRGIYRNDFLSKKFSRVGVAVKLDQNSLKRNARPQIFVIVIFGGKQLQELRVPAGLMVDEHHNLEE